MRRHATGGLLALAGLLLLSSPTRADETGEKLRAIVETNAPKIVTLRAVLKIEMSFGGMSRTREQRSELQGVVVDESGLILLTDGPFGGGGGDQFRISVADLKVVIENEDKEYNGFLVATDSKLHIAFVQIEDLEDRKLGAIDLKDAASPAIGDPVVTVSRMDKGYDYAPYFSRARISGKIKKPRKAWMLDGGSEGGLPVFTEDGKVVGVSTSIESGLEEEGGGGLFRMFGGGGGSFLLPARTIRASLQQATKKAVEMLEKRKKEKAEAENDKDGEGEKDEEGKKEEDEGGSGD